MRLVPAATTMAVPHPLPPLTPLPTPPEGSRLRVGALADGVRVTFRPPWFRVGAMLLVCLFLVAWTIVFVVFFPAQAPVPGWVARAVPGVALVLGGGALFFMGRQVLRQARWGRIDCEADRVLLRTVGPAGVSEHGWRRGEVDRVTLDAFATSEGGAGGAVSAWLDLSVVDAGGRTVPVMASQLSADAIWVYRLLEGRLLPGTRDDRRRQWLARCVTTPPVDASTTATHTLAYATADHPEGMSLTVAPDRVVIDIAPGTFTDRVFIEVAADRVTHRYALGDPTHWPAERVVRVLVRPEAVLILLDDGTLHSLPVPCSGPRARWLAETINGAMGLV